MINSYKCFGKGFGKWALSLALGSSLTCGCQPNKLAMVGREPPLTHIKDPTKFKNYRPISMPMPAPQVAIKRVNSLWQDGATSFFKDQRARQVGDILTIAINFKDEAKINNSTEVKRDTASIHREIGNLAGYEHNLKKQLPHLASLAQLLNMGATSNNKGSGVLSRDEEIKMSIAATVVQVMPNGNLVVWGHQELRVNYEVRDLTVTGIVRPEDVSAKNMIQWNKVAEARVTYGGRGHMSDVQAPPLGQQLVEALMP